MSEITGVNVDEGLNQEFYDYHHGRMISPERVEKARPKQYVPELTAAPLDVLIPLILNAPYDFINTQFTDEVLRAHKEKHIEKKTRKYYAEIVFQVNLIRHHPVIDEWFERWFPPDEGISEWYGRVIFIESNVELLEEDNFVTAEDFYILETHTSLLQGGPGGPPLPLHRLHRFSLAKRYPWHLEQ